MFSESFQIKFSFVFICLYTGKNPCPVGSTWVCTAESSEIQNAMVEVCPDESSRSQPLKNILSDMQTCNCLPIRLVEQDLAAGINPLGSGYKGCAFVLQELVFPDVEGF